MVRFELLGNIWDEQNSGRVGQPVLGLFSSFLLVDLAPVQVS
jgi:hypothetical protein